MEHSSEICILIIDDDDLVRTSFKFILEALGFKVFVAENGKAGLDVFRAKTIDLVLTDLRMPVLNGFEVLNYVTHASPETPVIVISGGSELSDAIQALQLGAWDFITKPIRDNTVLEHAIKRALEQANLKRENRLYREHLEKEVRRRTQELQLANEKLRQEIRERQEIENELYYLKWAIEKLQLGVTIKDVHGNILYTNPEEARLHGYSVEDLHGKNPRIFAPASLWKDMTLDDLGRMENWNRESVNLHRDGHAFPVQLISTAVKDLDGRMIGVVTTCQDITVRKQSEKALRNSELILSALIDSSDRAIFLLSNDYDALKVNKIGRSITKQLWGYEVQEGQNLFGTASAALENFKMHFARALNGEHVDETRKMKFTDGTTGWFDLSYNSVRDDSGIIIGVSFSLHDVTAKKQRDEKLRLTDQAIRSIQSGVIIADAHRSSLPILDVNPAFEYITGWTKNEVAGKPLVFLHGDDRNQPGLEILSRALSDGRNCRVELRSYKKDGALFWNILSVSPIYDENRQLTHFVAVLNDITDRREAEKRLMNLTTDLKEAQTIAHLGYWHFDIRVQQIIYWSDEIYKQFGRTATDGVPTFQQYLECVYPDDRKELQALLNAALAEQHPCEIEFRALHKDGTIRWIHTIARLERDEADQPQKLIGASLDVTERRQAQEALQAEKERLAVTLASIGDGVITTDTRGHVVSLNKAAERLTAHTQDEAAGQALSEVFPIIHAQTRGSLNGAIDPIYRADSKDVALDSAILISLYGLEYIVDIRCAPIHDSSGETIGGVLVFRDVTESNRLKLARRNFINAISHELRTPLTPIIGGAELMLNYEINETEQKSLLNEILQAALRERRLVEELLAVARLESNVEQFGFVPVNAYEFFNSMTLYTSLLVKKTIQEYHNTESYQFSYHVDEALKNIRISIDSVRIQHVMDSLLVNAIIYSLANKVQIETMITLVESTVCVSVRDHGIGIAESESDKIFQPFYQIRKEHQVSDGIGLGLTLAWQYVEAHGGKIDLESKPGQGSTFTFKLPILPA